MFESLSPRTTDGVDTHPSQAVNYTSSFRLVYNPDMSTYDDDTIYRPGINTGEVNYMRLSLGASDDTMTVLEFIHNIKKTGDHVDIAEVVGTVQIHRIDLPKLVEMLTERVESLS